MALVPDPPPRPEPDDPPFPWYAPFLVGLSLYVGLGVTVAAVAAAAGWTSDLPDRFVLAATLVQDVLLVVLAVGVAAAFGPKPLYHLGLRRAKPSRSLLHAGAAFAGFFAFLVLWQQLLGISESDDLAQELGAEDSTLNLVVVAVLVCLFAPVAEELFFRGFMYGALRKAVGWIPAALVTGVVFGMVHAGGTDAVFLVPLAVLGVLLCWLYRRTGSLIPGMAVHAFNNALALGATLGWDPAAVLAIVVAAPAIVVALATAVAVRQGRPGGPAAPTPPEAGGPGRPPVFLPPVPPR